jgi:alpha-methylacyl-CoA racemase
MKYNFLNDISILDFTTRLPGPLSTKLLCDFGARVVKCENIDVGGDLFNQEAIHGHAPNFKAWYQNLNSDKDIVKISFRSDEEKITELINNSNVILIPDSRYFQTFLSRFQVSDNKLTIKLAAGKEEFSSLHDLNVLGLTKTFKVHLAGNKDQKPPYLPFAGIAFAQYIASFILAALRDAETKTHTVYMKDIVEHIFDTLYAPEMEKESEFLHNGAFPAYDMYTTKDGKILCLAAIEEKYWLNLIKIFSIKLEIEDRFDKTGRTSAILEELFSKFTKNEIKEIIKNQNICLTFIR